MDNAAIPDSLDASTLMRDPSLSLFQKVLLATDGTVTQLLELYTGLPVKVHKLAQELIHSDHPDILNTNADDKVLKRAILLRSSTLNLLYAESYFVIDRLPDTMHRQLLESDQPIGLLWRAERMETYREVISYSRQADSSLSQHFSVADSEYFLSRSYLIFRQHKPLGMITEKFPASYFRT